MRALLFLIVLLSAHAASSWSQEPFKIQNIRLGNVKKSVTHYGKFPCTTANITYDDILANPKLVCEIPGYTVSHYMLTFVPRGSDIVGPYQVSSGELTERERTWLTNMKEAKAKIKIAVEDIQLSHNGKDEPLRGTLFYECK